MRARSRAGVRSAWLATREARRRAGGRAAGEAVTVHSWLFQKARMHDATKLATRVPAVPSSPTRDLDRLPRHRTPRTQTPPRIIRIRASPATRLRASEVWVVPPHRRRHHLHNRGPLTAPTGRRPAVMLPRLPPTRHRRSGVPDGSRGGARTSARRGSLRARPPRRARRTRLGSRASARPRLGRSPLCER